LLYSIPSAVTQDDLGRKSLQELVYRQLPQSRRHLAEDSCNCWLVIGAHTQDIQSAVTYGNIKRSFKVTVRCHIVLTILKKTQL